MHRSVENPHSTAAVSKKVYPKEKAFMKLTYPAQLLVLQLVMSKPGIYLREILLLGLMLEVDMSLYYACFCIVVTKKCCRLPFKEMTISVHSISWMSHLIYTPEMLVFLDEMGADHRNCFRISLDQKI